MARPEAKIQGELVEFFEGRDWMVEETHGNLYQFGIPDLFIAHVKYGTRWIDTKVEGRYSFTPAQKQKWPIWERHGVGIWILTAANEEHYARLFKPPNWRDYWKKSYGELPDIDALLRDLQQQARLPDRFTIEDTPHTQAQATTMGLLADLDGDVAEHDRGRTGGGSGARRVKENQHPPGWPI